MSHVLAFLAGALAMLALMIWSVEYPISIRWKRPAPAAPDPGGGFGA